jgi:hypothetical protein
MIEPPLVIVGFVEHAGASYYVATVAPMPTYAASRQASPGREMGFFLLRLTGGNRTVSRVAHSRLLEANMSRRLITRSGTQSRVPRIAVLSLFLSACATPPAVGIPEGEENFSISTFEDVSPQADPLTGNPLPRVTAGVKLEGVTCELSNDKGRWTVAPPASVRIQRSSSPLKLECSKPGYKTASGSLKCLSARQREQAAQPLGQTASDVMMAFNIPAGGPIALAAVLATRGKLSDVCNYGPIHLWMTR